MKKASASLFTIVYYFITQFRAQILSHNIVDCFYSYKKFHDTAYTAQDPWNWQGEVSHQGVIDHSN